MLRAMDSACSTPCGEDILPSGPRRAQFLHVEAGALLQLQAAMDEMPVSETKRCGYDVGTLLNESRHYFTSRNTRKRQVQDWALG